MTRIGMCDCGPARRVVMHDDGCHMCLCCLTAQPRCELCTDAATGRVDGEWLCARHAAAEEMYDEMYDGGES